LERQKKNFFCRSKLGTTENFFFCRFNFGTTENFSVVGKMQRQKKISVVLNLLTPQKNYFPVALIPYAPDTTEIPRQKKFLTR
jgi:hypothetical protein